MAGAQFGQKLRRPSPETSAIITLCSGAITGLNYLMTAIIMFMIAIIIIIIIKSLLNPLNAELNPICHLLALLGGATIVVVSRLRVNLGL